MTTLEMERPPASCRPVEEIPAVSLFGISIHAVRMPQAVETVLAWIRQSDERCRYVVTPNVDHVVQLDRCPSFRAAYTDASLVLADGWPIVAASRWLGRPLPERVAGSDLVPALFSAGQPLRVFLLGAAPGVADRAAQRTAQRWPHIRIVGTHSPPKGFENRPDENSRIVELMDQVQPELLLIGLGAPKQELWVHRHHERLAVPVALCVGATIDFLAGARRRAPLWIQRLRCEWLFRMASEPRRLAGRYARDAWVYPQLVWREAKRIRV
jgi:N-acetylglucosaminyldiphosphoundecaprenol N-acetyl-beta-D-mannosaminyltransferase